MSAAGPLKVYIYLCACYQGQPVSASIPQLKTATGLKTRSVNTALKALREKKLIPRIAGRGNQANQYGIPLPKPQKTAAPPTPHTRPPSPALKTAAPPPPPTPANVATPPGPALKQATPPEATPPPAITPGPIPAPPSMKPGLAT